MTSLVGALRDAVGAAHVLTGSDTAGHDRDWTGRFGGPAAAVARPATTEEVAEVLRVCAAHGAVVVPQGGNTGLVGGSVPRADLATPQVVLSTLRLDAIAEVDVAGRTVRAGAGAVLSAVDAAAAAHGLRVGVDLASRDSATVGGMVATNAGGVHVVAHGTMRQQVLGVQAVLADGRVIDRMAGLAKDNAGYDLAQLLAGSEGTLAVITAVLLRLHPAPTARTTLLAGVADPAAAVDLLHRAGGAGPLHAAEIMSARGVGLVAEHLGERPPAAVEDAATVVLLEWSAEVEPDALQRLGVDDTRLVVAQDDADRRALWRWRERHTEAIGARGPAIKLDLSLPLAALAAFIADVEALADEALAADAGPIMFGHLAEGTLHVNLPGSATSMEGPVLERCAAHGGSIAAEHGVGIAKAPWLHLTRSAAEISLMRQVKHAADPHGLLNPGVILPSGPPSAAG